MKLKKCSLKEILKIMLEIYIFKYYQNVFENKIKIIDFLSFRELCYCCCLKKYG